MLGVPIGRPPLSSEASLLAARKAALKHDLERMLTLRGPVTEVRRLVEDLDRATAELAEAMRRDAARQPAHQVNGHHDGDSLPAL